MLRGRVYRALPMGFDVDHYFVVVSNNARNRALPSVLAVRLTTTPKPVASPVEEPPLMVDGEAHLESLMQMEALLAVEDTHSLSDQQIAFLLY